MPQPLRLGTICDTATFHKGSPSYFPNDCHNYCLWTFEDHIYVKRLCFMRNMINCMMTHPIYLKVQSMFMCGLEKNIFVSCLSDGLVFGLVAYSPWFWKQVKMVLVGHTHIDLWPIISKRGFNPIHPASLDKITVRDRQKIETLVNVWYLRITWPIDISLQFSTFSFRYLSILILQALLIN